MGRDGHETFEQFALAAFGAAAHQSGPNRMGLFRKGSGIGHGPSLWQSEEKRGGHKRKKAAPAAFLKASVRDT
jgi:hypothetical protein